MALDSIAKAWIFNGKTWTFSKQLRVPGFDLQATSVSCPTATFCVAIGGSGYAFTYHDGLWSQPALADPEGHDSSVSCSSPAFCMVVGSEESWAVYNGHTWSAFSTYPLRVERVSVSCPANGTCFAGSDDGYVYSYSASKSGIQGRGLTSQTEPKKGSLVPIPLPAYTLLRARSAGGCSEMTIGAGSTGHRVTSDVCVSSGGLVHGCR